MKTSIFFVVGLLLAVVAASRAAAPAGAGGGSGNMQPGLVLVAKVVGTATIRVAGAPEKNLKVEDIIPQGSVVTTGDYSRLVLALANGALVSLAANTEIVMQEFSMEPLPQAVLFSQLTQEPTTSRTRIRLNRGELVGDVKKVRIGRGSSFTVAPPVGAAGIRGAVFRVLSRPTAQGYAFTLSTVSETVISASPPPAITASGTLLGINVPAGQELQGTVEAVTTVTGKSVVTTNLPPQTGPVSATTNQEITSVSSEMAASMEQATFAPAPQPAAIPLRRPTATPAAPPPAPAAKPDDLPKGPLSLLEAIRFFEKWGGHAEWADDLTEFTIDSRLSTGSVGRQYFEVQRDGGAFTVREIAALTRPLIDHGILVLPPLNFTETAEMNAAYYRANPGAVPGQFVIPPGGPFPRPPKPPVPGAVKGAPGTNVAGGAAGTPTPRTITINGVTSSGATFTGTVTVTPVTTTPPPPLPPPPRIVPPQEVPPR